MFPSLHRVASGRPCQPHQGKYAFLALLTAGIPTGTREKVGDQRRVVREGFALRVFAGKVAVITGASSGIGRALAKVLVAQGVRVGVVARREDLLHELVQELHAEGGTTAAAAVDVKDRVAVGTAIQQLAAALGPIDLLIANAGMSQHTGAAEMNVPAVEEILRVNLLGMVYAIEAVLPGMISRGGGHIVGVSSLAAYKGLPGAAAYCASKAAMNAYLEALRIELQPVGVAVTTVCPGFVRTAIVANQPRLPFLMEPREAATRIVRALRKRPATVAFPWPMVALMRLARWLPDSLIARVVGREKSPPTSPSVGSERLDRNDSP